MKLVEYKCLLINLKTIKTKKLKDEIERLKLELANLRVKHNDANDKK